MPRIRGIQAASAADEFDPGPLRHLVAQARSGNTQPIAKTRTEALVQEQSLPLLQHLARTGRRVYEAAMTPGGLRPRHLIALNLLSYGKPLWQAATTEAGRPLDAFRYGVTRR